MELEIMNRINDCKKYIKEAIQEARYPQGHPFLNQGFYNDYVFIILSLIKYHLVENDLIDDLIKNKLRAIENEQFNLDKYYQGLSELTFFYYLLSGIINNGIFNKLAYIIHEPNSPYNKAKKLEYSFCFLDNSMLNVEIKTITCDPFSKEKDLV